MKPITTQLSFYDFCIMLDDYVSPSINDKVHIDFDTLYMQNNTFFLKDIRVLLVKDIRSAFKFDIEINISDLLILAYPDKILYLFPYSMKVYKTKVPKSFSWSKI